MTHTGQSSCRVAAGHHDLQHQCQHLQVNPELAPNRLSEVKLRAMIINMKHNHLAAGFAAALVSTTYILPAAANPMIQLETITTAMNSIPDIIFYKDMQGFYRGGNTAWSTLLGKPLDQLIGKTDLDLFPEEIAKSFQSYDKAMLAGGKPTRNKEWLVYPDGKKVYVETLKTPWIGRDGKVVGVLGICHEIKPDFAIKP
jgi:PAS domain S-box-containing protein